MCSRSVIPENDTAGLCPAWGDASGNGADSGIDNNTMVRYLQELRRRLLLCLAAVIAGNVAAYGFLDEIFALVMQPAGQQLYYLQPTEAFFVYAKVNFFSGVFFALPVIFYQLWAFIFPALTVKERLRLAILVPISFALFVAGIVFSFKQVLPVAMSFFLEMGGTDMQPMVSADYYLDFLLSFVIPFGVIFQLPFIMLVLAQMGLVTSAWLAKYFRHVILLCFIFGAIFTPPDVVSQCLLAIPMIALYGAGWLGVKFILRK